MFRVTLKVTELVILPLNPRGRHVQKGMESSLGSIDYADVCPDELIY